MAVTTTQHPGSAGQASDASVFELVDALVEVVDSARDLDRLRVALDVTLQARELFEAELRFSGLASSGLCFVCGDIVGEVAA